MITFRTFEDSDVSFGMALTAQAGWNQREADWRRALGLGGCFVACLDGEPVGTVTTCRFGARVGWVGLLLVDQQHRRCGVGTALLHRAIAHLRPHVETVRLDASELGRPLYEQHGFVTRYHVVRYHGTLPSPGHALALPAHPTTVFALDRAATGVDREGLLAHLLDTPENAAQVDGGFVMVRPGANAWQVGPLVARDESAARALFAWAGHRLRGAAAFVDVPEPNAAGRSLVVELGLRPVRTFWRMDLGPATPEDLAGCFAGSGPEKG